MGAGGCWSQWSEIVTKSFKKLDSRALSRSVSHFVFTTYSMLKRTSKLSKAKNTVKISLISYEQYMVSFLEPIFAHLLTSFCSKFGGIKTEIVSFYLQSLGNIFSRSKSNKKGFDGTMRSLSNNKATRKSETTPPQQCTVKVTGLLADTSEDLLRNYFENKRRSRGGPVSSVDVDRERQECFITFESSNGNYNIASKFV